MPGALESTSRLLGDFYPSREVLVERQAQPQTAFEGSAARCEMQWDPALCHTGSSHPPSAVAIISYHSTASSVVHIPHHTIIAWPLYCTQPYSSPPRQFDLGSILAPVRCPYTVIQTLPPTLVPVLLFHISTYHPQSHPSPIVLI
jgi:hypothetical protein